MLPAISNAQGTGTGRGYFHEKIDASQQKILAMDGITAVVQNAASAKTDSLQAAIEADTTLTSNDKIKFLRGFNDALLAWYNRVVNNIIQPALLPGLIDAFGRCMHNEINNESILTTVKQYPYFTGQVITENFSFSNNPGLEDARSYLLYIYCLQHPKRILETINKHPGMYGADSLIVLLARLDPEIVYNYASANEGASDAIRNSADRLVKIICKLAQMPTGRQIFPFLDEMYHDRLSFDVVDSALADSSQYYKLMVQTQVDYAERIRQRDTPIAMQALATRMFYKAREVYVSPINDLHEAPDEVRFKIIDKLTPEELYYLPILTEEEIYTSSYVRGVYPRIFKKLSRSDSLLMRVRFDRFKKWIKIAANFNTLDDFLRKMDKYNAELLMKAFVNGLDKAASLEDAVDVANSFGSINDKGVRRLILNQVQYSLQKARAAGSKRGMDIYGILNTLFLSMDSANHVDVSKLLGIPPVFYMPATELRSSADSIIVEQFFYGDKDGRENYEQFRADFSGGNWKITDAANWITVSSTRGAKVVIYSNKPLDEKKNLDFEARKAMVEYLDSLDLRPSVLIHRGHSYYLGETLEKLQPSNKIILLGSCGGYQSLKKVLVTCPVAHIVASKQTGSKTVNGPLIKETLEMLRQGKDLNWIDLWQNLGKDKLNKELFDDYIPPYKNLGALFIMAYNRMQGTVEQ
jgi:hypothetical protein